MIKPRPTHRQLSDTLTDKALKTKDRVRLLGQLLLDNTLAVGEVIAAAENETNTNKATLIEAMVFASQTRADLITQGAFAFAVANLTSPAPRVKWESAKVVANTAHLFPQLLKGAMYSLLDQTEHTGTVVRWSAAKALTAILACNTPLKTQLMPALEAIERQERDQAIKKIYREGLRRGAENHPDSKMAR